MLGTGQGGANPAEGSPSQLWDALPCPDRSPGFRQPCQPLVPGQQRHPHRAALTHTGPFDPPAPGVAKRVLAFRLWLPSGSAIFPGSCKSPALSPSVITGNSLGCHRPWGLLRASQPPVPTQGMCPSAHSCPPQLEGTLMTIQFQSRHGQDTFH